MKNSNLQLLVEDTIQHLAAKGKNLLKDTEAREIMESQTAFDEMIAQLSEGLTGQDAEDFATFAESSRTEFLNEGAVNANLYAFAPLQMTLIRSVLPRLIARKLANQEVMKTPADKFGIFKSYLIDAAGNRVSVSDITADTTINTGYRTDAIDISAALVDHDLFALLSVGDQAIEVKEIDRILTVTEVSMTVNDAGDLNPEAKVVPVNFTFQEDGLLATQVSATHSGGHVTTETIFAQVNYIDGTISLSTTLAAATEMKLKWRLTSEHNNANTYEMEVEYIKDNVEVDSGRVINMSIPFNYLQDVEALFSVNGLSQATSMLGDSQLILEDREILNFTRDTTDGVAERTLTWDYAYDAATSGISRADHNLELVEKIHYSLAMSDNNTQFVNTDEINILCNPIDAAKISSNNLVNKGTFEGGVVAGQMNPNYKVGQMVTPNGTINFISTRQIGKGGMYVVPKSSNKNERVITHYTYSNILFANSEIRNSKDSLVKNMCALKRDTTKSYNPQSIIKLTIENA